MITLTSRNIVLSFIFIGFLLVFQTITKGNEDDFVRDRTSLIKLYNTQAYSEIIKQFKNFEWVEVKNPYEMILYCFALSETDTSPNSIFKSSDIPKHMIEFCSAYVSLMKGNTKYSDKTFEDLATKEKFESWGYIGLLEQSIYTENFSSMASNLDKLKSLKQAESELLDWAIPFYSLIYHYKMANFDEVENIFNLYKIKEKWFNDLVVSIKINILLRTNKFEEAKNVLNKAFEIYGMTEELILAESNIIYLEKGADISSAYLKERISKFPKMWKLKQQFVFHLLETDQKDTHSKAASVMKKISDIRRHDVLNIILTIDTLMDLGFYDDAGKMLHLLNKQAKQPTDFTSYNTLMAKMDFSAGMITSLKKNLDIALQMSPMESYILWFQYGVAEETNMDKEALDAIHRLLHLDPYNQAVLTSLAKNYYENKQWEKIKVVADKLLKSPRHKDSKLAREMEGYVKMVSKMK